MRLKSFFWIFNFFAVGFGRGTLSKVTYVTVLLPVILMTVLVFRTAFLEGAGDGIAFYIGKFDVEYLGNIDTWSAACSQIIFSLGGK